MTSDKIASLAAANSLVQAGLNGATAQAFALVVSPEVTVIVLVGPLPERVATRDMVAMPKHLSCYVVPGYRISGTMTSCYPRSYPKGILADWLLS
jgi:hypothetical protein